MGGPISELLGAKSKSVDQIGGKGPKGKPKNLTPVQIAEITAILTKVVGPKLAHFIVKIVVIITNGLLGKVPLHSILKVVVKLLIKLLGGPKGLLGSKGLVGKLLGGGHPQQADAAKQKNGKLTNLTPEDQRKLTIILSQTLGPYTSSNVVHLIAVLIDGVLGKIPLNKLLHGVGGLVGNLLKPKGLVGKLVGRKGLGGLVSKLLGANPKADAAVKGGTKGGKGALGGLGSAAKGALSGLGNASKGTLGDASGLGGAAKAASGGLGGAKSAGNSSAKGGAKNAGDVSGGSLGSISIIRHIETIET